ncbi:double-strand break repair protein MRE11 isoform X2 [Toxorhynchites rutilus septentrionalis]|uniref:double-strand break repair protein MRE11 isoform X2 n=1 Tax=Toxorhynchites rutilus septentrionalis TaxID=329112 RepID=UPI002478AEB7|nr:double-strand break repair protein MRE11 isoform X2 [Toxorhynchites rutilus septentrionalis]
MSESTPKPDPEDIIKILVASDIHLGYNEKDVIRGEDSFIAFEEVLQHALENDVDAVLLGGDLFHIANPSTNTLNRCSRLLKTYMLGDKPIKLEFLSDQNENFLESLNRTVNYEDPNMNIAIPVFSIHGNHDDPSGFGRISSLDLLSTNGYVNYFGKWTDLTKINISPILLKKGETKLALYGLSYISDARLARLFNEAKVFLEKPEDSGWFNIMVLHQNRADRGPKNYLPEKSLPGFLDLVIWGHEHDCRIVPEENFFRKFFVSQPGSTVATSLAEGEAIDKCCGVLSIHKSQFRLDPIQLQTVRPFIFESINLADYSEQLQLDEGDVQQKVQSFAAEKVEEMIERAKGKLTGNLKQPKLPLIRLRLEVTETEQQFNAIRFGQQYSGRVANPQDMIAFKKKIIRAKDDLKPLDKQALKDAYQNQRETAAKRAEEVVEQYFRGADADKQLEVLPSKSMAELTRRMVDYEDDDAAENIIKFHEKTVLQYLESCVVNEDNIDEVLENFQAKDTYNDMLKMLDSRNQKRTDSNDRPTSFGDNDEEEDYTPLSLKNNSTFKPPVASTGRGNASNARGSRSTGRGSRTTNATTVSKRGGGRGRGKTAAGNSTVKIESFFVANTTPRSRTSGRNVSKVVYVSDEDD